ncbi:phosphomannose isomerase type II C-terminal cupin domain [Parendozoicomonas haliclonae]|uniref:Alginate biosynthesis protein AlgA n=1 Tax=Parendozoicomonas haliclonae TaxID=1960125 RepID=A0A1X7AE39_9GAMM|nr:phosphomannose isomerase type II C-terminal cupin domain [Parendozoicomonas haliclonae]SMA32280.1 Alginate biosynthesis protein AlgA [Parendozoicomonas haliclonae]
MLRNKTCVPYLQWLTFVAAALFALTTFADEPFTVEKPWGKYEVLGSGTDYVIKRLTVDPGHRFSLQTHQHRDEFWLILEGSGTVTVGDQQFTNVDKGMIFHVPAGSRHRAAATGDTPLIIAEVQQGDCDEQDIVRLEDDYQRASAVN